MTDRDLLYQAMRVADESRKRQNFEAFMDGLEGGLTKDLDREYAAGNMEVYNRLLNNVKAKGIRVFRNSEGKHRLKFI